MTDAGNSVLEAKLDVMVKLLALFVAPDTLSLKDRAIRLHKAGLAPKEIATLCNTTPNTVSVALSAAKRAGRKPKAKGK